MKMRFRSSKWVFELYTSGAQILGDKELSDFLDHNRCWPLNHEDKTWVVWGMLGIEWSQGKFEKDVDVKF